jgi:hypothetical protein
MHARHTFTPASAPGSYTVVVVRLVDGLGNRSITPAGSGESVNFSWTFEVSTTPDDEAPELEEFELSPDSVDTSGGPASLTFDARVTDDVSGLSEICASLSFPGGGGLGYCGARISGNRLDGRYRASFPLVQFAQPGTYTVDEIHYRDRAGNLEFLSGDELEGRGFDLESQQTGPGDDTDPEILDFEVLTSAIQTASGNATVHYRMQVRDDLSGFATSGFESFGEFGFNFGWPGGGSISYAPSRTLVSGTPNDGIYSAKLVFDPDAPVGRYDVSKVYAGDRAGNYTQVQGLELIDAGWDFSWVNQP